MFTWTTSPEMGEAYPEAAHDKLIHNLVSSFGNSPEEEGEVQGHNGLIPASCVDCLHTDQMPPGYTLEVKQTHTHTLDLFC